jgi:predicted permease
MQDELSFHLQSRADDLARAGHSPAEAMRLARIEFGGLDQYKEHLRDTRHFGWVEDFARDFAYAGRNLLRAPLFALSAAGAIALGIGVNAAVFSLVYGLLFRSLPAPDPGSLRNVYMGVQAAGRTSHGSGHFVSFVEFAYLRAHARTADLAGISEAGITAPFAPAGLHAQLVSDNLFGVLGGRPALGRFFNHQEASAPGTAPVAVLSYDAWQKYFGGQDVTGHTIVLNRTQFTIVGVAGRGFYGPLILKPDIWIPVTMQALTRAGESLVDNPSAGFIQVFARRRPGVSDSAMLAEMRVVGQQAVDSHASGQRAAVSISSAALFNYPELMMHSAPILGILFAVVSMVLLVACANVGNMLVARGFGRSREIAIRLSIGAGKGRLVRQLLTEHMLLALLGGIGGLALASVGAHAVFAALPTVGDSQIDLSPDWRITAWTFLVALGAGAVFGLPAALGMTRSDLTGNLRGGVFEAGVKHRRFRLQNALIVTQVAISALLLINAGLLVRAAVRSLHTDFGHAVSGVLIAKPNLREMQYTPAQAERYLNAMRLRASAMPGVTSVSWTGFDPVISGCGNQARAVLPDGTAPNGVSISCFEVGAGYFRTMGMRILAGRPLELADERGNTHVAVVDEDYARRYLPGNPLGRRVRLGNTPADDHEVVGVAGSTTSMMFLAASQPQIYTPLNGLRYLEARLLVAYQGPHAPLERALQEAGRQLDKDTSVAVKPIEENVNMALSFVRVAAGSVATLGALALLLACSGVYGVVAFTVGRRGREIGVRIALGAPARSVMHLLVWQSIRPVLLGICIGTGIALALSRLLRAMLYGVSPADPAGFGAALALLAAVAAVAAFVPASAALRVDPSATLRHE